MRRYKKNKRKNRSGSFGEIEETVPMIADQESYIDTAKQVGLIAVSGIAGAAVGSALGKHSLLTSIPVAVVGVYKKNIYIIAASLGLALANGFQRSSSSVQGVEGLDVKQITQDAKDRVKTFFENFKDKLYLSHTPVAAPTQAATNGLGEASEEQVTYFVNPYGNQPNTIADLPELDMSAIDRIQEQIAEMNRPAAPDTNTAGLNEVEREF